MEITLQEFLSQKLYNKYKLNDTELKGDKLRVEDLLGNITNQILEQKDYKLTFKHNNNLLLLEDSFNLLIIIYAFACLECKECQTFQSKENLFFADSYRQDLKESIKYYKYTKNYIHNYNKTKLLYKDIENIKLEFISNDEKNIDNKEYQKAIYTFAEYLFPEFKKEIGETLESFIERISFLKDISHLKENTLDNFIPQILVKSLISNIEIFYSNSDRKELDVSKNSLNSKSNMIQDKITNLGISQKSLKENLKNFDNNGSLEIKEALQKIIQKDNYSKYTYTILITMIKNNFIQELNLFQKAVENIREKSKKEVNYALFGFYDSSLIPLIIFLEEKGELKTFTYELKILNLLIRMGISDLDNKSKIKVLYENKFLEIIKFLSINEITKIQKLLQDIIKKAVPNNKKLKSILSQLNYSILKQDYKTLLLLPNLLQYSNLEEIGNLKELLNNLTAEHILPQQIDDCSIYGFENEEEYYMYLHSIGNLTLLDEETNTDLGNISPFEKADIYIAKQEFRHIQELGKQIKNLENKKELKKFIQERQVKIFEHYL